MATIWVLQGPGRCAECGAYLPPGSKVRFYRGRTYGLGCHQAAGPRRVSTRVAHLARRIGFQVTRAMMDIDDPRLVRLTVKGGFPGPNLRMPGEVRREPALVMWPPSRSRTLTWIYVDPTVALQGTNGR